MAKGSPMGLWRGKKGSNVFYRIANSNNGMVQGIRQRVVEVRNPKTAAQASQRIKMRAAQNFFNALAPILNRSMQGVKYGGMTRNEFMSYALSMVGDFPFIDKGDTTPVPGEYLLSKGSLNAGFRFLRIVPGDSIQFDATGVSNGLFLLNNAITAEAVQALVSLGFKEGDQITVVRCNSFQGTYVYDVRSCFLSVGELSPFAIEDNAVKVYPVSDTGVTVAAAIIISRKEGTTYLRNTETMHVDKATLEDFYTPANQAMRIRSYMKPNASANVDWPVDPSEPTNSNTGGDNGGDNGGGNGGGGDIPDDNP